MLVAAPGRSSTTNGCPSRSESHWPISLARMSVGLPAVILDIADSEAAPAARCKNFRRGSFMVAPRELAHRLRHAINYIQGKAECLLLALSGHQKRADRCLIFVQSGHPLSVSACVF